MIPKVITFHPVGIGDICAKFHGHICNNVNLMIAAEMKSLQDSSLCSTLGYFGLDRAGELDLLKPLFTGSQIIDPSVCPDFKLQCN